MSFKKPKNRLFAGLVMSLMCMLAVCTVVFAQEGRSNDSYSLIVKKEFASDTPREVLEQAMKKEYKFEITGTKKENGEVVKVNESFTLPREVDGKMVWESPKYSADGPFDVTVTESTDNIAILVGKEYYNMSDSSTNAAARVNAREHSVTLRNNSTLTITRPEEKGEENETKLWYHLTSKQDDMHPSDGFEAMDVLFCLSEGESKEFKETESGGPLRAGRYTIEQIVAPDGYRIKLGTREERVEAGKEGHFHINGTPGKLTITAGGTKGDGATHYYKVERTETEDEDESEFEPRTEKILSGEDCIFNDLPKGGYTVTEYSVTEGANESFSVQMSKTDKKISRTANSSAPQYNNYRSFNMNDGMTYFRMNYYGPLLDNNKTDITDSGITYDFSYGMGDENGKITRQQISKDRDGKSKYSWSNSPAKACYPKTPKIAFLIQNLSDSRAKFIKVGWTEYKEHMETKNYSAAGVKYTDIVVGDSGKLTIMAPDPKVGAEPIVYYYAIRNNKNKLVTFEGKTDKEDTSIKLKAGEKIDLSVPEGSYKITETVDWENVGFTMKVEGAEFGTSEVGVLTTVQVGGERTLTITKNDIPANDERTYIFNVTGPNFSEKVNLSAGKESGQIILPKEGRYSIAPQNDMLETYELKYTDSGAVYGTVSGSTATVVFTNSFNKGDYAYRYIHEYYVRHPDGNYEYEGNSLITTMRGRNEGEVYQASDIKKEVSFNGAAYTHFDESYGWVTPLSPSSSVNVIEDTEARKHDNVPFTSEYKGVIDRGNGIANTDTGTREIEYAPVMEWKDTKVTTDAREIIILRYYRDEKPEGKYKVIHEYYLRDKKGDHWEGSTGIKEMEGELGIRYTEKNVVKKPDFTPDTESYTYEWDKRALYGETVEPKPDVTDEYTGQVKTYQSDGIKKWVEGTEDGSQIIILRYYRKLVPMGFYKIVHEYYLREKLVDYDVEEGDSEKEDGEDSETLIDTQSDDIFDESVSEEETDPFQNEYKAMSVPNESAIMTPDLEANEAPQVLDESEMPPVLEASEAPANLDTGETAVVLEASEAPLVLGESEMPPVLDENGEPFLSDEGENPPVLDERKELFDADEAVDLPSLGEIQAPSVIEENEIPSVSGENETVFQPENDDGFSLEDSDEIELLAENVPPFEGTLSRDKQFDYTFEGKRPIESRSAPIDSTHMAKEEDHLLEFNNNKYSYYDAVYGESNEDSYSKNDSMQWASSTEAGNQIIILRYYREEEPETGNLKISKTVADKKPDSTEFEFTLTLKDKDDKPLTEVSYQEYSPMGEGYGKENVALENGEFQFELSHGASIIFSDLPMGTQYIAEETQAEGYDVDVSDERGTINEAGKTIEVSFMNRKKPLEMASLSVEKTVVSDIDGDKQKDFHFKVDLTDKTVNGTHGDLIFENGSAQFTLKHGEKKTADNLPVGIEYTVTESEADQDGFTTTATGETGTLEAGKVSAVKFTNTRKDTPVTPGEGMLTLSKHVVRPTAEGQQFEFTVWLTSAAEEAKDCAYSYNGSQQAGGTFELPAKGSHEMSFYLRDRESVTLSGLPIGTTYRVTETQMGDYQTTVTTNSGSAESLSASGEITAEVPKVSVLYENRGPGGDRPPRDPDDPPDNQPDDPPDDDPDDPPDNPPDDPPDDPENPPDNPPDDPETPPEEPETPSETPPEPEYPTELPDPNDPDSPDEITIIGPDGVPLTYLKVWDPVAEEWVYLPEDEVPLAMIDDTPQTGDGARPLLWGLSTVCSLCGIGVLLRKKRRQVK